jgi:hypothetical protein
MSEVEPAWPQDEVAAQGVVDDELRDALLGVKTTKEGMAGAAAVPSASSFVLLENEEQFICPASPTAFLFLIRNRIL